MKKRMSILAVLVLAVTATAYFVGGTYAKYTSNADVSGSAQVAKWNIKFTDGTTELASTEFDLGRTADTGVVDGKIAPGTEGSFTFGLNSEGTEVAYSYGITFTVAHKPTYLKFYSNAGMTDEITAGEGGVYSVVSANVAAGATGNDATPNATVYWKWVFEDGTTNDATDTTEGIAAATMTVNAKLTATQLDVAA